jgi:peptide-methionine (S)-S-oxide reductase
VYRRIPGVKNVVCGYAGGHAPRPTYPMVQTGLTGHAEVVQVVYDPSVVTYERLLEVFWHCHDPTTLNRQGPDVGDEYRSIILVTSKEQSLAASKSMSEAQKEFASTIVTQIEPLKQFWKAEAYHQNYYQRNGYKPYCRAYIAPKLQKLGLRP